MFYSSTDHNFMCGVAGSWLTCNGLLYSNTAASTAITTCTNTCAAFNKVAPIPANYCQAGRVIRISARGTFATNATGSTISASAYYGTDGTTRGNDVLLGTSQSSASLASAATWAWSLDINVICQSTATMNAQGFLIVQNASGTSVALSVNSTSNAVVTTSAKNIYIFPTFGTSNASNTITLQQLIVTGN
jgi:uncharacterized lipoprotein NlpE involved in copper resistance